MTISSFIIAAFATLPPSAHDPSHAAWTEILSEHVRGDGFDYAKLKEDPAKLDRYLASLEMVQPEEYAGWKVADRMAFWIDAYNAYTVRGVLDVYPIASLKDLERDGGKPFWDRPLVPLGKLVPEAVDRKLTLNEIENDVLRPVFKDARVHAALNCAARSCPPLLAEAYVGERLERQLDARVEKWLADPARNRYERDAKRLKVSKIFEWYRDDFVREADSVKAWIAQRAPAGEREWLESTPEVEIEFLEYSWDLNDAK